MEPDEAMNPTDPAVGEALDRLRRGALESCVLCILRVGPAYSHDIVRTLAGIPGLVTSEGTVYPLLSRLRRAGLVQTHWQESPSGPPRRYYMLTDEGARAVASFTRAWASFRHAVDSVVSGAALGSPRPAPTPQHPLDTTMETR